MAGQPEISNLALFCDFENIALGVRDAKFANFDIRRVLERLLLKGSIVVKKAYCDWDRYREFKRAMHEASFELIEIPHVRQSGKNSADIRMVVDALDLCYTKSHVDAFVIISGDSDFSPLVSKLRENNKRVIGIGVRDSTSDLLAANCDEFIFYDDLVRDTAAKKTRSRRAAPAKSATAKATVDKDDDETADGVKADAGNADVAKADGRKTGRRRGTAGKPADKGAADKRPDDSGDETTASPAKKDTAAKTARPSRRRKGARDDKPADERGEADGRTEGADRTESRAGGEDGDTDDNDRRQQAIDLLLETIEALAVERGDDERLWGSMVKQTMKRRRPDFSESSFGYKSFRDLVDDAAARNLLIVVSDERPGQYALRLPPG